MCHRVFNASSRCAVMLRLTKRMMKFMSYLWRYLGLAPQWHGFGPIFSFLCGGKAIRHCSGRCSSSQKGEVEGSGRVRGLCVSGSLEVRGFVSLCYGGAAVGMVHSSC